MKRLLALILLFALAASPAWGANTVTVKGNVITITGLDADFTLTSDTTLDDYFSKVGVDVHSITFYPSAANDRFIIHDGGIDAIEFYDSGLVSAATDPRVKYYPEGSLANLVIDISDCTLGTAASAKVEIVIRGKSYSDNR